MRCLRRRPRVFLSYSRQREGEAFAEALAHWLDRHGCVAVWDRTHLQVFDELSLGLRQLIDSCDALIAVGTEGLLASGYCRQEVEYAVDRDKLFVPLLCAPQTEIRALPDWFTRKGSPGGSLLLNQPLRSANDLDCLTAALPRLRRRVALDLRCGIALAFILLLVLPGLTAYGLRELFTNAGEDIREAQASVEAIHLRVEAARELEIDTNASGPDGEIRTYLDSRTGELLAQDTMLRQRVTSRSYFRDGKEIAIDRVEIRRAANGEESRQKTREILVSGRHGPIIRDRFDSSGRLIAKEVRWPGESRWSRYGDSVLSDYPTAVRFVLPYR